MVAAARRMPADDADAQRQKQSSSPHDRLHRWRRLLDNPEARFSKMQCSSVQKSSVQRVLFAISTISTAKVASKKQKRTHFHLQYLQHLPID